MADDNLKKEDIDKADKGQSSNAGHLDGVMGVLSQYSLEITILIAGIFIGVAILIAVSGDGGDSKMNNSANNGGNVAVPTNDIGQPVVGNEPTPANASDLPQITSDDHILGSIDAPIKIVEYSDFECPFCKTVHPTFQQIVSQYDGKVAWVYRHYPLDFNPNSMPAALASECVAGLGGNDKFWSFTDYLFENQSTALNAASYEQKAKELGIDVNSFRGCVDSGKYEQKIKDQMAGGIASGVQGTPGNFIVTSDGQIYSVSGAQPIGSFTTIIDQHI